MSDYQQLMSEAYSANQNFKKEWSDWRNGKLKKSKKKKTSGNFEPESVTKARNDFWQKNDLLFVRKILPLEEKLRADFHSAFAELIEFLSVDIPAFRCGYAKEIFLQLLKQNDLTKAEIEDVQQVALKMCETENVRREFRRWCRLIIRFADEDFILKLQTVAENKHLFPQLKSKWMIEALKKHRPDLKIK